MKARTIAAWLVATAVAVSAHVAAAQAPTSPGCSRVDIKVLDEYRVWVNCGRAWPAGKWTFTLWEYDENWELDPTARIRSLGIAKAEIAPKSRVARLTFPAALHSHRDYRLLIVNGEVTGAEPVVLPFTTQPAATLTIRSNRTDIALRSTVALKGPPECAASSGAAGASSPCILIETITPRQLRRREKTVPPVEVPHPVHVTVNTVEDVAAIGEAVLTLTGSGLSDGAGGIRFKGLTNVFGEKVDATGAIGTVVPATADEAEYALKIGLQAGSGQPAAYSFDAALKPTLTSIGLTYWRLLATADLGHNDKLSANSVTIGSEVVFPFRQRGFGPIFGFKPVVRVTYETDKHGDVGNILGTAEAGVRLRGLFRPRKYIQSVIAVQLSEERRQPISAAQVESPNWGFVVPLQLGVDLGGTVRTPETPGAVNGDRNAIARLRVASGAIVEYKRLAVTESIALRYLLVGERAGQTDASAPAVDGLKSYNELVIKVSLDRVGHYALALTYKYGEAPPSYKIVNSLVSSVAIMF